VLENWIDNHPWMTFILGIMSLLTLNTFFVSIGGGYKKFPQVVVKEKVEDDEELLND
jgi:hypothetical protein